MTVQLEVPEDPVPALCGHPVVPPPPALPGQTFRLDVSNYYVILTLTILGDVELFGFSTPP